jgi:hypothetical protein
VISFEQMETKMITLKALKDILLKNEDANMQIMLPDDSFIPPHFHVTEIGKVQRDFVDCGGTVRSITSCLLQILVADDVDHRRSHRPESAQSPELFPAPVQSVRCRPRRSFDLCLHDES